VDGDGNLDIIVADPARRTLIVLRNTRRGSDSGITASSFSEISSFPLQDFTTGITLGDVDGDGQLDILLVSEQSKSITILKNTGRKDFSRPFSFDQKQSFATSGTPYSVALGDLDGDGKPEMILKQSDADGRNLVLSVYQNRVNPLAPQILSYSPVEGTGPGGTVTLTGNHFTEVQSISFGGVVQPQFTVDSRNQITVVVPEGAISDSIVVTTNGGRARSLPFTAISPADAVAGISLVCQQAKEATYFVSPIPGALAYQWTLPKGASIVSGAGTNFIIVDFNSTAASGKVSVRGVAGDFAGKESAGFSVRVDSTPAAPLQLLAATSPDGTITLTWKAPPADNTANFFIERAENSSENFLQISIRPPNENSYVDNTVTAGTTYYYRIRARLNPCFSGYSNISGAATATNVFTTGTYPTSFGDKIKLFPNPTTGVIYIELDEPGTEQVNIQIFTLVGVVKKELSYRTSASNAAYPFDISGLEAGVYFLRIDSKKSRAIKKIIKL
jgi:hypothetical protein